MIEVLELDPRQWSAFSSRLQEFENVAEYPLGDDFFRLDHGASYFSFFERLGEPIFHVALDGERLIACAAGVLREIPTTRGNVKAWYLCDLKVHPSYRGQRIPARLFRKRLFQNFLRCARTYAISMNPSVGQNRVIQIAEKFPFFPVRLETQLNLYSLDWQQMVSLADGIRQVVGPLSYLSLRGKKDLILKSTGERLNLLHVQHGALAPRGNDLYLTEPQKDFTHMICAPQGSRLDLALKSKAVASASASVIGYRVRDVDWSFILTSDI